MMGGEQFPSLTALLHEFQPPAEEAPWWVRWNVIPITLCLCILLFGGHAVGEF